MIVVFYVLSLAPITINDWDKIGIIIIMNK